MKRLLALCATALLMATAVFAQDFAALETLHDQQKYEAELAILKPLYNAQSPQAAIVYRITRATQEIAVKMPANKGKEKIAKFDEAIDFAKPLVDKVAGTTREKAQVIYWYAVSMSQKGKAKGVLNSLFMLPDVRALCDKASAMDPGFGDPYYLKAMIDDAVPEFAGGDKARMGALFAKARGCDPNNLWYMVDGAKSLKTRNKDAAYNSDGKKGVPAGKSDLDYARVLAKMARDYYATLSSPTIAQKELMDDLKAAGL